MLYSTSFPLFLGIRMEAIKKKMQAMKVEKDNLCDRCDEVEQVKMMCTRHVVVGNFRNSYQYIILCSVQKAKEAHIRQEKAEEECTELTNKARTLEIDVDKYGEKLAQQIMAQEAKEAQVMAAEAEFNRLNRR